MTPRLFQVETEQQRAHLSRFVLNLHPPFQCEVGPIREARSLTQNARLWLLHTAAAEVTGCSPARMHEDLLCEHYGYTEKRLPSGDLERVPLKRSSARDKKEFAVFMEFVERFYGDKLGVWLDAAA